ncbi:MAG: M56 family metallopeptidase [bacterium]
MSGFADICIAALAGLAVALAAGATVGWAEKPLVRALRLVQPDLRAAAQLALLAAPLGLGVFTAVLIALSPHGMAFDLVPHHCHVTGPDCVAHEPASPTAALSALGGGLMAAIALWIVFSLLDACQRAGAALRLLMVASDPGGAGPARILRTDAVIALAAGFFRSRLFLSRGLCDRLDARERDIVLAHEEAHGRRFDNLARLIGAVFALGHWPRTALVLRGELALAQEQSCDREAARHYGVLRAAETLVKVERLKGEGPRSSFAAAYVDAPVAARVRALLEPDFAATGRSSAAILLTVLACLAGVVLAAEPLHHEIETLATLLQD